MTLRVRFAPSPTGYLHVGGARTAIFNWLVARGGQGAFVLRIEDTDRERSREEHTGAILDGLAWLGIDWDEGPHYQSDGVERHRRDALRLLEEAKAYRDFADPAAVRAEADERGMHASRVAREKAERMSVDEAEQRARDGDSYAVRFRVPDGETRFTDLVHGDMYFRNDDIDDLVILRSDGSPVYNMAVVSDDAHMGISHVIRGDDHLSNTPKQALLYRALGLPEPVFAHVPLILGSDGKRLSKRHGATAVGEYASEGILPEAMLNFLTLLGWSPGDDREFMTRSELVEAFTMERVLKKSSVFDLDKLSWLNRRHMAELPVGELVDGLRVALAEVDHVDATLLGDVSAMTRLVELLRSRARTIQDLTHQALPFLTDDFPLEEEAVEKHWARDPQTAATLLEQVLDRLETSGWSEEELERSLRGLAEELEVGAGKLIHPLRVAVTGRMSSPGIFEVLTLLGRESSLRRLRSGIEQIRAL